MKPMGRARSKFVAITLTALTTLATLATVGASVSHGDTEIIDTNDGWTVPFSDGVLGSENALFSDRNSGEPGFSALLDRSKQRIKNIDPTCSSTTDASCDLNNFGFTAQIPMCQSVTDNNCLEAFGATDAQGTDYPGTFNRYYPEKAENQFDGNPDWNLPSGGAGSLFTIPGVAGPAGNNYYVSFIMSGQGGKNNTPKVILNSITANVTPVQIQDFSRTLDGHKSMCLSPGNICNEGWNKWGLGTPDQFSWGPGAIGDDTIHNCVDYSWVEKTCAQKEAFPAGFKFYLKARLTLAPTGWLHGRMTDPNISLTQQNGITELEVSATPVAVPIVFKSYLWSQMPKDLQALYDPTSGQLLGHPGSGGFSRTVEVSTDPSLRAWTVGPAPSADIAIPELNYWLPYVDNTAVAVPHYWSFRTLSQSELQGANKCFTDPSQLNGIVTTNATTYSAGPPTFDKAAGNLNYKVAAPHLTNAGEVFHGTYDLVMRSTVARCIYGFTSAPIKASISVLSATGSPEIATTIVNEKEGWLHLSANGFEFSSPTVAVSLVQDAPVVVQPVPAAKVVIPQKKTSIRCTKGKLSKTISGIAPKCPAGYKAKK
jgi:hypothetical protein